MAFPRSVTPPDLSGWLGREVQRIPLRGVAVATVLLLLPVSSLVKFPNYFSEQALEYQKAAYWLASQVQPGHSVMAAKPHVAFFSGARIIDFREHNVQHAAISDLPAIFEKTQPTFFIFDERYGLVQFPQLHTLLDQRSNPYPELLTPVLEVTSPKRLIVYRYIK